MSEDVSATMRVGITVILVAALVATVLNLMVMSNSLLSGGQTTLQSGIDSVSTQEFASYDNTKVSGTQVSTALSLFQGRDVAIIVQTKALAELTQGSGASATRPYASKALNYGALVTSNGIASNTTNKPIEMADIATKDASKFEEEDDLSVITTTAGASKTPVRKMDQNLITAQAKTAYLVDFAESTATNVAIYRPNGAPNYEAFLHNTSGLVDSNYDTIGTTELGNAAYILSSARFSSVLIKDPTGSIIGIFFKQLS